MNWKSGMSDITDLRAFVRVVERADLLQHQKTGDVASGVSKLITRLEDRLGRAYSIARPGVCRLRRKARSIICVGATSSRQSTRPRQKCRAGRRVQGRLRINCLPAFAVNQLAPSLSAFLAQYPEIELELALTDRVVDLLGEKCRRRNTCGPY